MSKRRRPVIDLRACLLSILKIHAANPIFAACLQEHHLTQAKIAELDAEAEAFRLTSSMVAVAALAAPSVLAAIPVVLLFLAVSAFFAVGAAIVGTHGLPSHQLVSASPPLSVVASYAGASSRARTAICVNTRRCTSSARRMMLATGVCACSIRRAPLALALLPLAAARTTSSYSGTSRRPSDSLFELSSAPPPSPSTSLNDANFFFPPRPARWLLLGIAGARRSASGQAGAFYRKGFTQHEVMRYEIWGHL